MKWRRPKNLTFPFLKLSRKAPHVVKVIDANVTMVRKFSIALIDGNGLWGLDVFAEYDLILEKKSRLSSSLRNMVVSLAEESMKAHQEKFVILICLSLSFSIYPQITAEFNKDDTWKSVLKNAMEKREFLTYANLCYSTNNFVECLAMLFASFKTFNDYKNTNIPQAIFKMEDDEIEKFHSKIGKLIGKVEEILKEDEKVHVL